MLVIGLIILPSVFWPFSDVSYEVPRVWFFSRLVEVLAIVTLFSLAKAKNVQVDPLIFSLVLAFGAASLLSSFFGADLTKSVWGNYYRADGLFTLLHLVGFALILQISFQRSRLIYIFRAVTIGNLLVCLGVIFQDMRFYFLRDASQNVWRDGAFGGVFGNPVFLAGYLVVTLPFLVENWRQARTRFEKNGVLFAIAVQIAAIFLTRSWGGVLGLSLFLFLLIMLNTKSIIMKGAALVAGGVLLSVLFLSVSRSLNSGAFTEGRLRILPKVFFGAMKRPILGWGVANVDYAFSSADYPFKVDRDAYVDKAHSSLLEVFATTGIVGLAIYAALIFVLAAKLWRQKQKVLFVALLLFIFHSQTNIVSIGEEVMFWMMVGVGGSGERKEFKNLRI